MGTAPRSYLVTVDCDSRHRVGYDSPSRGHFVLGRGGM